MHDGMRVKVLDSRCNHAERPSGLLFREASLGHDAVKQLSSLHATPKTG
jgi:hypothetical protein